MYGPPLCHTYMIFPLHIHSQCQIFILQWVSTLNRGHLWMPLGTVHKRRQHFWRIAVFYAPSSTSAVLYSYPSANFEKKTSAISIVDVFYGWPLSMHSSAMVRPQILQYIRIPTWNKSDCGKFPPEQITENMICAGKPTLLFVMHMDLNFVHYWNYFLCTGGDDKDACQGDSGGPLGTVWSLVRGLTSFPSKYLKQQFVCFWDDSKK